MRGISVVVGLVVGVGSLMWLGNRGPTVLADGDHPLPSATARYQRRTASGPSRFLPSLFGRGDGSPSVVEGAVYEGGDWIEVPVLAVDLNGRPLAGASIETRTTTADLASGRQAAAEIDARIAAEEALNSAMPAPPQAQPWTIDPAASVSHARISVAHARTGRDGRARVRVPPLVQVMLLARGPAGEEGVSAPVYVVPEGPDVAPPEEVTIEAAPLAVIVGDVRDERGRPITDATITISPRDLEYGTSVPELVALGDSSSAGSSGDTVYSGANGAFRIPLRRSGAYDLTVEADGFQLYSEPAAQAMSGHESTLHVTMLEAAEVRGRIVDASGAPVPVAYADLRGIEGAAVGAYVSVTTMEDGSFLAEGLPPGNYELRATATGFRGARVDIATGARSIEVRLDRGTILAGTIAGDLRAIGYDPSTMAAMEDSGSQAVVAVMVQSAGAPIPFFSGSDPATAPAHEILTTEPRSWGVANLDRDGRGTFEIPGLPPGDVLVFLQAGELRTRALSTRLVDGTTSSLHLRIDGTTIEPPEPLPLMVEVTIELPVEFSAEAETMQDEPQEEPEDEPPPPFVPDLRLDSGPTGPFVVRAGLPSSGTRLVGGDRVVAIDGTRLSLSGSDEDPNDQAQNLLMGPEHSTCTLIIERPATGETLTISLVRSLPWSPPRHGCRLIRAGDY